jgi:hypothetical protein
LPHRRIQRQLRSLSSASGGSYLAS